MTTNDLLPTVTRLRATTPTSEDAAEAVRTMRAAGLSLADVARLCALSGGQRGALSKLCAGEQRVRSRTAAKIMDGYGRYTAGDRSYLRERVHVHLGPRRKRREDGPHATEAPEPGSGPILTAPGLRERLIAARREGRRV